jgi:hypothetical protein
MIRLISFGMVCVVAVLGLAFATQDITLKKLYDPIEDFQAEYQAIVTNHATFTEPKLSIAEKAAVESQVKPALIGYLKQSGRWGKSIRKLDGTWEEKCFAKSSDISDRTFEGLSIFNVRSGSLTKVNSQQQMYTFGYCDQWEGRPWLGSMIFESGKLLSVYVEQNFDVQRFSVSDVNQNGLSEVMVVVAARPNSETTSIRLLEFPDGKIRNLGDIPVGVQPGYDEIVPSEFCANNVDAPVTKKTFLSNIIYVLKSSTPQFFSEQYDVNCNYRNVGVKARKVHDLTPIKSVLRPSGFIRIF